MGVRKTEMLFWCSNKVVPKSRVSQISTDTMSFLFVNSQSLLLQCSEEDRELKGEDICSGCWRQRNGFLK